jgi:hypothetical protein
MPVVAKRGSFFNKLAIAGMVVLTGLAGSVPAPAAPGDSPPHRETSSPEPVLALEAPDGHCLYDAAEAMTRGNETAFQPGLRSGTELLALYVPCLALEAARAGTAEWLPEWVAIEKNTVTYPSDDERSLGTYGAVKQLCQDAQSAAWGHPRYENPDFAALVNEASSRLSDEKPEVFLGVIGEEEHACYLSALRIVFSPSGAPQKFLIVTAFMQAGDRWITQSIRRTLTGTREGAEAVLDAAKRHSKFFADSNR